MTAPGPGAGAEPDAAEAAGPGSWLERHGDALYRFARSRVARRETAEDLVQEALLAALQAAGGYRGEASARTWLLGILRRKIADHYRRGRSAPATVEADLPGPAGGPAASPFDATGHWRHAPSRWRSPEAALDDAEFWGVVRECTERMPGHLARAFLLREVDGVEVERLGPMLRVAPGNLRVRLHRARLLLRSCLERRWFGAEEGPSSRRP